MDAKNKMWLQVTFWNKKRHMKEVISFEIKDKDDIKPIIKELRRKRLKILSYGVLHRISLDV